MPTTRHSWLTGRTDYDRANNTQTDFCTCRVCGLVRKTIKFTATKTFEVTYIEPNGTEHERKLPYPCKPHCNECKQEIAFE
jgi:hypothetical protein